MVSPAKQIWKDFSSGKGGNVVSLMEHEHFTFPEAIKFLAKKYNIEVEEIKQTNEQRSSISSKAFILLQILGTIFLFKNAFRKSRGENIGLAYFQEEDLLQNRLTDSIWDIHLTSGMFRPRQNTLDIKEFLVSSGLTIQRRKTI